MSGLDDNRLVRTFRELRSAGLTTLAPFLTAGFPDAETTVALLHDFESRGVPVCELGIPFSDPIADGPTIQSSFTRALEAGFTTADAMKLVRSYRDGGGNMSLVAMVSYSIVFRYDVQRFLAEAADVGFDGVLIPDSPLEEAGEFEPQAADAGLANVMLIAPTTPPERRIEIAHHCRGFIYYVSVAGITGERDKLPEATIAGVRELRNHTDTAICVGFGISRPEMVRTVCQVADAAIVGSAIVHRIADAMEEGAPREEIVRRVGDFVSELIQPTLEE
ncbi:MAG: tryptophan synthase subunit alpha, partial [Phycisphaerae bacterium]